MPQRPKTPCRKCKALHRNKSGYCDLHLNVSKWRSWQKVKGNSTKRGYGWAWQQLTKRIRQRDNNLCQPCYRKGRLREADAVDHIVPKSQGGDDSESNLECICDPCHRRKTATERK